MVSSRPRMRWKKAPWGGGGSACSSRSRLQDEKKITQSNILAKPGKRGRGNYPRGCSAEFPTRVLPFRGLLVPCSLAYMYVTHIRRAKQICRRKWAGGETDAIQSDDFSFITYPLSPVSMEEKGLKEMIIWIYIRTTDRMKFLMSNQISTSCLFDSRV